MSNVLIFLLQGNFSSVIKEGMLSLIEMCFKKFRLSGQQNIIIYLLTSIFFFE